MRQPDERATVGVRFLDDPSLCLWCWDFVDPAGRVVESSSWESEWKAYDSPKEALRAGLTRLAERSRASRGARAPGRGSASREARDIALIAVVARGEAGLYRSLKKAFAHDDRVEVVRDRRSGDRRQRAEAPVRERRRGDRRSRPWVDAQVRSRGWSMVNLFDARALSMAGGTSRTGQPGRPAGRA